MSHSASQSESEAQGPTNGGDTDNQVPAGETAPVATTETVANEVLMTAPAPVAAEVLEAEVEEALVEVEEEEVPLAVVELDPEEELVQVEEEEVPLAEVELDGNKNWWWWLLGAAAAATGKAAYDKKNKKGIFAEKATDVSDETEE